MLLNHIDKALNNVTMYKVVLYGLTALSVIALVFGLLGLLPFTAPQMMGTLFILILSCYVSNHLFARLFKVPVNAESEFITAYILFFILSPIQYVEDVPVVVATGVLAMAAKYLLVIHKRHIFNPAAIAVFIIGILGFGNAIWWAGSTILLPAVTIAGLLAVRKIRKFQLFFSFVISAVLSIVLVNYFQGVAVSESVIQSFTSWPLIFFATIMLTEPFTMPPTSRLQIVFGGLVGLMFGQQFHVGPLFTTPELALIVGNLFAFAVRPGKTVTLTLNTKHKLSANMWEFVFAPSTPLTFQAGQYMEWTLAHKKPDQRGNRRYFTIASSPTESEIRLGVKIPAGKRSSYKEHLNSLESGDTLNASHIAGDFLLPEDIHKKLVFIAGGIGITPFRSMVQYLLDTKQTRDAILFYAAPTVQDFAYKGFFDRAEKKTGVRVVYIITRAQSMPRGWNGSTGYMTKDIVRSEVPDISERTFYLSGPVSMVDSYKHLLTTLGVKNRNIVTDYFPGF